MLLVQPHLFNVKRNTKQKIGSCGRTNVETFVRADDAACDVRVAMFIASSSVTTASAPVWSACSSLIGRNPLCLIFFLSRPYLSALFEPGAAYMEPCHMYRLLQVYNRRPSLTASGSLFPCRGPHVLLLFKPGAAYMDLVTCILLLVYQWRKLPVASGNLCPLGNICLAATTTRPC